MIQDKNGTRGLYVVFEGPDGSGKSTLSRLFVDALRGVAHEEDVVLQAFPTRDGEVGKLIRRTFSQAASRVTHSPDAPTSAPITPAPPLQRLCVDQRASQRADRRQQGACRAAGVVPGVGARALSRPSARTERTRISGPSSAAGDHCAPSA